MSRCASLAGLLAALVIAAPAADAGSIVRFKTSLGKLDFVLLDDAAPGTTLNFQGYALRGDYDSTFVHRSVRDFVIQGGGFGFDGDYFRVPTLDPIRSEREISNVRGTVAVALAGGNLNSGTSQWFVNLVDNLGLDADFTVFARVPPADMAVVDAIAGLTIESGQLAVDDPLAAAFANLPVLEPLDRFVGECSEVLPEPSGGGVPNVIDNCADDDARSRDVAARIAALADSVPERLVMIEKAVVLPTATGSLAVRLDTPIVLLEKLSSEVLEDLPKRNRKRLRERFKKLEISGRQLRDAEWGIDISSSDNWRATAVPVASYGGTLEPRGTSGRRFGLTLDPAVVAEFVENARTDLESRMIERSLGRDFVSDERLSDLSSEVVFEQIGEPKFRAIVDREESRITIRGRIPVTGFARMIAERAVPVTGSPLMSDVVTPIEGDVRFKVKGPFRRFEDAPAP